MTANAPFMIFSVVPSTWSAVAWERFSEGSNGINVNSLGASATLLCVAELRMAASTGSCPPSELAKAAKG